MKTRFIAWLKQVVLPDVRFWISRFANPNKHTLEVISEDLRKVGVTIVGVAIVGLLVPQVGASLVNSLILLFSGLIIWIIGFRILQRTRSGGEQ